MSGGGDVAFVAVQPGSAEAAIYGGVIAIIGKATTAGMAPELVLALCINAVAGCMGAAAAAENDPAAARARYIADFTKILAAQSELGTLEATVIQSRKATKQ